MSETIVDIFESTQFQVVIFNLNYEFNSLVCVKNSNVGILNE